MKGRSKRGQSRMDISDGALLTLLCFPEPDKYLAIVRKIAETEHKDGRTIEHRM